MIYTGKYDFEAPIKIGNKAHYLKRIEDICKVPAFITIGTAALGNLLELNENIKLKDQIVSILINKLGIIENLPKIQKGIRDMYIPADFKGELLEALKSNSIKEPYAVRSSSTLEDEMLSSGAGIYESYTDIRSDSLFDSIKECWASAFSIKSFCYEKANEDINGRISSMGVIIQEYIKDADFAGVLFSRDPINPSLGARLEYVRGNGERLMSGLVSGQEVNLGFYDENAPIENYHFQEDWILELLICSRRIKEILKCEVDVEWVVRDKHLYILQCRPVTVKEKVIESEWIYPIDRIDIIPKEELGALTPYATKLKKKKVPFYRACRRIKVPVPNWLFARYGQGSDLLKLQEAIVQGDKGYYAIILNKNLQDIQCEEHRLAETMQHILGLTGLSHVTISVRYIPQNTISCISYYDPDKDLCHIECVPGVMKGIKSGYLQPTTYILDKDSKLLEYNDVFYTHYYDMDFATDTFFVQKCGMSIHNTMLGFIEDINKYTRQLYIENIIGAVEWWICQDKLYATDYSKEDKSKYNIDTEADENISFISLGDLEGHVLVFKEEEMAKLEDISYGCSISVDRFNEQIYEFSYMQQLIQRIEAHKADYGSLILAVPIPLLGICPLLTYVDGIVFKNASKLCHLSIILREKGIPAVEVGDEFDTLKDGQRVSYSMN